MHHPFAISRKISMKNGSYSERIATHASTADVEKVPDATQSVQSHAEIPLFHCIDHSDMSPESHSLSSGWSCHYCYHY